MKTNKSRMGVRLWTSILFVAGLASVVYAINNQYIYTYPPNNVTQDYLAGAHWEPSTAVGGTWVHSYLRTDTFNSYSAAWNSTSGQWVKSSAILAQACPFPGCVKPVGDVYLSYDQPHSQYIAVGTSFETTTSSLYFGTSTDGLSWGTLREVLSGPNLGGAFDYGSVAVDSAGRIIVGAVKYYDSGNTTQANGFWVSISSDGGNSWSAATEVVAPTGSDIRLGINSRVAAAGNQFYVFTPTLLPGAQFQPTSVSYYVENGGVWSGPNFIMAFDPPMNNSPAGTPIYYAPLIDASGNSSGTWAVTFQTKSGDNNNVIVCKNNPLACYAVNPATDDEFLSGVSVSPEGGVWLSYLTYSSLSGRQLPLYQQSFYLPPAGGALGVTGDYNVDPTSWRLDTSQDRCISQCYAMGDYARIGSNSYPGISSPYVNRAGSGSDLFQIFALDPQGPLPKNTFTPRPVYYRVGSDIRGTGKPNAPGTLGIAPEKRRKVPGKNGH